MHKRRDELATTPLDAAVTAVMRDLAGSLKHAHAELWARWRDVVGPDTYRRSFPSALRGTTLIVGVSSSSWMQELSFLKAAIIDRISEEIGPGVVTDIKLVLDPDLGDARVTAPGVGSKEPG
jgi:hypothetical protein